jgi:hypothetical protein
VNLVFVNLHMLSNPSCQHLEQSFLKNKALKQGRLVPHVILYFHPFSIGNTLGVSFLRLPYK